MRKLVLALLVIAAVGGAIWYFSGGVEKVTEARVRTVLTDRGVPYGMADCMAHRMATKLTIAQLHKLERLAPEKGETMLPHMPGEALNRLDRVGDPEAIRVTARAAAVCALGSLQ